MVPGNLGKLSDGVNHHHRALPAICLVFAPYPAAFEIPMRQLLLEPLLDLGVRVDSLGSCHRRDLLKECGTVLHCQAYPRGFEPTMEEALRPACTGAEEVAAPCDLVSVMTSARLHFGFLDPSGRGARPFGSFGLAIARPPTRLALGRG